MAKRQVYKKAGAPLLVLSDERTNIFQQRLTQSLQQQQKNSTGSAYYDSNLIGDAEGLRCSSAFLYSVRAVKKHWNEGGLANIGGLVRAQTFSQSGGGHWHSAADGFLQYVCKVRRNSVRGCFTPRMGGTVIHQRNSLLYGVVP